MSLSNLKATVDQLVELTPVAVQRVAELRAAGIDPAELQALADVLDQKVAQPLAASLSEPPKTS